MYTFLLIVQMLMALGLVATVLLQQGKGADMGAAFGSGASGTVFGARGAGSFLSRVTAILAVLFFINSLLLAIPAVTGVHHAPASVTERVAPARPADDAVPGAPADMPPVPEQEAPAGDLPPTPSDMPE